MRTLKMALAVAGVALATQAAAQITLYEGEGFRGPAITADKPIWDFDPFGFNDRARVAGRQRRDLASLRGCSIPGSLRRAAAGKL